MIFGKKKYHNLSDEELIEKYSSSSKKEWAGELFNRHAHLVYGSCLNYLRDEELAKDEVMAIFEKLLAELKKTKPQHFKSWLYVVTKNHCFMILRSAKSKVKNTAIDSLEIGEQEEIENIESELVLMEDAIEQLNPAQSSCIKLFYLQEKSYAQVAESTGYTMKEVKSYIQNGKRNLQLIMNSSYGNAK